MYCFHLQDSSGGAWMSKETGVVKWFSRLKGYGFINPDDGGQEVFVHYSAIEGDGYRNLYEGDRVEFEMIDRGKGPQAQKVITRHT
jgi:CspA family cold shock protein